MKTTVLITINYNDYESTSKFLDRIKSYNEISHIVIVDNNSSDGSFEKLRRYQSGKVHVITTNDNMGYARGNNFGIKYALKLWNVDYFVISNPDVFFAENLIKKLVDVIKAHETLAICSAVMRYDNGKVYTNFASRLPEYIDILGGCFMSIVQLKNKIFRRSEYPRFDLIKKDPIYYTDVVPGSFFLADRKKFEEVGFFDERTFLYYEENILALKLKKAGYREAIVTEESYKHLHSVTISKNIRSQMKKEKIMFDSAVVFLETMGLKSFFVGLFKMAFWIGFPERQFFMLMHKIIHK